MMRPDRAGFGLRFADGDARSALYFYAAPKSAGFAAYASARLRRKNAARKRQF